MRKPANATVWLGRTNFVTAQSWGRQGIPWRPRHFLRGGIGVLGCDDVVAAPTPGMCGYVPLGAGTSRWKLNPLLPAPFVR